MGRREGHAVKITTDALSRQRAYLAIDLYDTVVISYRHGWSMTRWPHSYRSPRYDSRKREVRIIYSHYYLVNPL